MAEVPSGGGKHTDFLNFSCGFSSKDRTVTARRRLAIERRDYPRSTYGELQNFFDCVVQTDRDLAVGVRIKAPAPADANR